MSTGTTVAIVGLGIVAAGAVAFALVESNAAAQARAQAAALAAKNNNPLSAIGDIFGSLLGGLL